MTNTIRPSQHLEAILRSIPDYILAVDKEYRVLHANKPWSELCLRPWAEGCVTPLRSLADFSGSQCLSIIASVLQTGQPVVERRVQCSQGARPNQVFIMNCVPLRGEDGETCGAVLVAREVAAADATRPKRDERRGFGSFIGMSRRMQEIYELVEELASLDANVLITGESGTGKELAADALHHGGRRAKGPFIKVNCAALSENILESELFGHVRGAFTGADRDAVGRFEAANGGTLFLDEIGDISQRVQLRLLRVLESKEFERLGEAKTRKVDIRIIAATNADLEERVRGGLFRADLYYRLKVMMVRLPPLRERSEDVPLLVEHFIAWFNKTYGKTIKMIAPDVQRRMMAYSWPGNVRELKHILEHACILCKDTQIIADHMPQSFLRQDERSALPAKSFEKRSTQYGNDCVAILEALRHAGWNKSKAARLLGISRLTLYRRIAECQLHEDV